MPKFLAIHTLSGPVAAEEVMPLAKKVRANSTLDAYWVKSIAQLNEEGKIVKVFCEWNAVDAEAMQKVFAKIPELPVDGIYPMATLDSEDFR